MVGFYETEEIEKRTRMYMKYIDVLIKEQKLLKEKKKVKPKMTTTTKISKSLGEAKANSSIEELAKAHPLVQGIVSYGVAESAANKGYELLAGCMALNTHESVEDVETRFQEAEKEYKGLTGRKTLPHAYKLQKAQFLKAIKHNITLNAGATVISKQELNKQIKAKEAGMVMSPEELKKVDAIFSKFITPFKTRTLDADDRTYLKVCVDEIQRILK